MDMKNVVTADLSKDYIVDQEVSPSRQSKLLPIIS